MEALIDIHAVASQLVKHRALVEKGSRRVVALMESDYVELVFRTREEVRFSLGDWVSLSAADAADTGASERYEITEPQSPVFNAETLAYEYKLRFDAWYMAWGNKRYRFEPSSGRDECSWALTDTLAAHMAVVVRNLAHHGWTVTWIYSGGGDAAKVAAAQYITFDGDTLLSALTKIAEAFGLEWWVVGTVIHMGRVEYGFSDTPVTLRLGHEVAEMSATQTAGRDFFNVFTAYGSERNLPSGYRRSDSQTLQNGVVQRRLMLPREEPLVYVGGVTADSPVAEKVEGVVTFDDVYPRTDGEIATVTPFDETVATTDPTTGDEVRETVTFWRFRDRTLRFSKDYILPGVTLQAVFSSGQLSGMTFDVRFNPQGLAETEAAAQEFEIIRSDTYGVQLPNSTLHPAVGDTYSLVGWDATKATDLGLIAAAERELLRRAKEYAATLQADPNTYTLTLMADWVYGRNGGRLDAAMRKAFALGDRVRIESPALFEGGARESRVIGLEYGLDVPWDGYKLTVGENVVKSRYSAIQGAVSAAVEQMTFGGTGAATGGTGTADIEGEIETVAKRVGDGRWLSKVTDDRAEGNITIGQTLTVDGETQLNGTSFGGYHEGVIGAGGKIFADGRAELDTLTLRRFLSVPKLVFNEVSVTKAEQWSTNGYGTLETVTPTGDTTGHATLHLERNEYGSLCVGDICRGIYADFETDFSGAAYADGAADGCGFARHYGFFTSYFKVTALDGGNGQGVFGFSYKVRDVTVGGVRETSPHPCAMMDVAQYGSFTDEGRRSSMYQTARGVGYIEVLAGVQTWEIQPENRVCRYGWLGGVTVRLKGKDGADGELRSLAEGYGLWVQDNVYLGGIVVTLDNIEGLDDLEARLRMYTATLSVYQHTVTVDDMGNVIGGLWTTETVDGVEQRRYAVSTAVFARKGDTMLRLVEAAPGEGEYSVTVRCEDCTANIDANGVVTVTAIENIKDGVTGSADDTSFDYAAMREMTQAKVIIDVKMENVTERRVEMPIRIVHSALPFMVCDLTNEMASVAWNTKERKYVGFPIVTEVGLTRENAAHPVDVSQSVVNVGSLPLVVTKSVNGDRMRVSVELQEGVDTDVLPQQMDIAITACGMYAGASYEYTRTLTIVKSADAVVWEVVPSVDCITCGRDGTRDVSVVTCDVYATSGEYGRFLVSDLSEYGVALEYSKDDGLPAPCPSGGVGVSSGVEKQVAFLLYKGTVLLDRESVPVVTFGVDGPGVEYVFARSAAATAPRIDSTAIQTDGHVPDGWTADPSGVSAEWPYEWVSLRRKSGGLWGAFGSPAVYAYHKAVVRAWVSQETVLVPTDANGVTTSSGSVTITAYIAVDGAEHDAETYINGLPQGSDSFFTTGIFSRMLLLSRPNGEATRLMVSWQSGVAVPSSSVSAEVRCTVGGVTYSQTVSVSVLASRQGRDGVGKDGVGYENIFKLTETSGVPETPTASDRSGWTDDPSGVSESSPYEWLSQRKNVNGTWGAFCRPALWARWSKDGNDGASFVGLTEYYQATASETSAPAVSLSGNNPGNSWKATQGATNWGATNKYLWNVEVVAKQDGDGSTSYSAATPHVIAVWTKDGKGISSITEDYAAHTSGTTAPGSWTTQAAAVSALSATNKYLWQRETIAYTDGTHEYKTHVVAVFGNDGKSYEALEIAMSKSAGGYWSWTFDGSDAHTPTYSVSVWFIDVNTKAVYGPYSGYSALNTGNSYAQRKGYVAVVVTGGSSTVDGGERYYLARYGGRLDGYWSSQAMAHAFVGQWGLGVAEGYERYVATSGSGADAFSVTLHVGSGIQGVPLAEGTRTNLLDNSGFALNWKDELEGWTLMESIYYWNGAYRWGVPNPSYTSFVSGDSYTNGVRQKPYQGYDITILDGTYMGQGVLKRGLTSNQVSQLRSNGSYTGTFASGSARTNSQIEMTNCAVTLRKHTVYTVSFWVKCSGASRMNFDQYWDEGTFQQSSDYQGAVLKDGELRLMGSYGEHDHDVDFDSDSGNDTAMGGVTQQWRRHTTTFCTQGVAGQESETFATHFAIRIQTPVETGGQFFYLSQPKLEEGYTPSEWNVSDKDKQSHKVLRDRGLWTAGEEYVDNTYYQDYVYRQATAGAVPQYFLCAKSNTAASGNAPQTDVKTEWWHPFVYNEAIAAKLVLTDTIKAQIMTAVKARIDELVVGRLTTMSNGATISIDGGEICVYGKNNAAHPNIVFGVNADGQAVLSYYDDGGSWLYDLGPSGITQQRLVSSDGGWKSTECNAWSVGMLEPLPNDLSSFTLAALNGRQKTTLYTWTDGQRTVGNVTYYIYPGETDTSAQHISHSSANGKLFTSQSATQGALFAGLITAATSLKQLPLDVQVMDDSGSNSDERYFLPATLYGKSGTTLTVRSQLKRVGKIYYTLYNADTYRVVGSPESVCEAVI